MPASGDGSTLDGVYVYENGEWRPCRAHERIREFASGATRDTDAGKPEPWRAGSALVEKRYAEYMYSHRIQHDGSLRASDNWKRGFPEESFFDSMSRHVSDLRLIIEGFPQEATEQDIEVVLSAIRFNVDGLLHETIKARLAREAGNG